MLLRRYINIPKLAFSTYSKHMHDAWTKDPTSVHSDWDKYFKGGVKIVKGPKTGEQVSNKEIDLAVSAYLLIRYYKFRGHELATLDPLGLKNFEQFGKIYVKNPLQLDLRNHQILNQSDLDVQFTFPNTEIFTENFGKFLQEKPQWTIRELQLKLKQIYCNKVGLEFLHISDPAQQTWIMHQFEKLPKQKMTKQEKIFLLQQLTRVQAFNHFLNDKLKTSKRFGVQGLDSMIPGMNSLIDEAVKHDIQYIGFGMAHRGRLSALSSVFDKPLQKIFAQFQENVQEDENAWGNSGDVKYHLGVTTQKKIQNKNIRLSILPNPSHLQTVNPIVMGHVRANQDFFEQNNKALAVLIHGDAALAGQGIVYQCLQMSYLNSYNAGGVIHVVANNQIGFTTTPAQARTGLYCTDVAKSIQAPIFHVNGDEPQQVNAVMRLAMRYNRKFKKDVFVDIIGYRRYGHNQQDQPAFTQPMMYHQIANRKPVYHLYAQRIIKEQVISSEKVKQIWDRQISRINEAYTQSLKETFDIKKWSIPTYHRVVDFSALGQIKRTGLEPQEVRKLGEKLTKIPNTFNIHPQVKKIYDARKKSIQTGQQIDFATAQSLAFASLITEGFNIRLMGQDVQRGTFSHRHSVLVDQIDQSKFMPLSNFISEKQKHRVHIQNSLLSEYGALGFQYGYSITNPNTLTIWQAQFGDFANGAQIIIDNYLVSGQSKWGLQSGLVMNLPHGMDGQGPQHSSARVQRFLQMMNDTSTNLKQRLSSVNYGYNPIKQGNMQIIYPTTAANLFHAYRRQLRRDYRKPLINMVSKKLLKLKDAASKLEDFNNSRFMNIIDETDSKIYKSDVKKVVLLCGQAYYSALEKRKQLQRRDVALIRLQEVAPFHYYRLRDILKQYKNCTDFVWFQEQHRNSGAWNYVAPRLEYLLDWIKSEGSIKSYNMSCVSRKNSASPAVGKKKKHDQQQAQILNELFR